MARRNADAPLTVEVPPQGADRPSWGRVGIITAIGFVVGVVWPRMAGVRLGPSVPEAPSAVAAAAVSGGVVHPGAAAGPPASVPPPATVLPPPSVLPPAAAVEPAASQPPAPSPPAKVESAQVTWEVALIRDAPRTGKILARLQRGTSLRVGAAKDGWYPVKYGDGFASDGWVFRGAIGR